MVRNIFGVLFLIGSGIFLSALMLVGFFETPENKNGGDMMLWVFFIPFIIHHLIGG